jgi:hypothetical protein
MQTALSSFPVRILRSAVTLAFATTVTAVASSAPAKAGLIIDFFNNFGEATPTGTSNPLLTVIIKNVTGGAEITIESFLEPPGNSEYVEQISFYLSSITPPGPGPGDTSYGPGGSPCSVLSGNFSCARTKFDVEPPPINQPDIGNIVNAAFNFPTANPSGTGLLRFDAKDKGKFFVPGFSEQLILTYNAIDNNGVNQTLYAGAKIQSIGNGSGSTSIGGSLRKVPAPFPILGAAAMFTFSRRLRKKINNT